MEQRYSKLKFSRTNTYLWAHARPPQLRQRYWLAHLVIFQWCFMTNQQDLMCWTHEIHHLDYGEWGYIIEESTNTQFVRYCTIQGNAQLNSSLLHIVLLPCIWTENIQIWWNCSQYKLSEYNHMEISFVVQISGQMLIFYLFKQFFLKLLWWGRALPASPTARPCSDMKFFHQLLKIVCLLFPWPAATSNNITLIILIYISHFKVKKNMHMLLFSNITVWCLSCTAEEQQQIFELIPAVNRRRGNEDCTNEFARHVVILNLWITIQSLSKHLSWLRLMSDTAVLPQTNLTPHHQILIPKKAPNWTLR